MTIINVLATNLKAVGTIPNEGTGTPYVTARKRKLGYIITTNLRNILPHPDSRYRWCISLKQNL